jgi:hypothetical protein
MTIAFMTPGFLRGWLCAAGVGIALAGSLWLAGSASAQGEGDAPSRGGGEVEEQGASPLPEAIVVLSGGQRIRGLLVEQTEERVVLRIAGVDSTIRREKIDQVIIQRPVREQYRELRAIIDDNDVDRLLVLVEWLIDRELLGEAQREVEHILSLEPQNGDALRQRNLIERMITLRERRASAEEQDREQRREVREISRPLPGEFPLLTEEQANLIKVYEVDLADPPRIVIQRETVDRLLNLYSSSPLVPSTREGREVFHRKRPADVLETMFRLRARDLYTEVTILGMPSSLRKFRDDVHATWLMNSCATTQCHGGEQAGRLMLYNRSATADRPVLTNLLILERFRLDDGTPLVDYARPADSPLLQMAMVRHNSATPHPPVRGWQPVFLSREDQRFRDAVEWLESMHRPRPDYPVDYTPPKSLTPREQAPELGPDR